MMDMISLPLIAGALILIMPRRLKALKEIVTLCATGANLVCSFCLLAMEKEAVTVQPCTVHLTSVH